MSRIPSYTFVALAALVILFAMRASAAVPAENPAGMAA
jgi:hypothetical protein